MPVHSKFVRLAAKTALCFALLSALNVSARAGEVVISATTRIALGPMASVRALGALRVKGKPEPVEMFVLDAVAGLSYD